MRPSCRTVAIVVGTLASTGAEATSARLGLGADDWLGHRVVVDATVAVDGRVTRHLSLGGRFGGVLIPSDPYTTLGIPLDVMLRATFSEELFYIEGLAGPWILFTEAPLRAHLAVGLGLQAGPLAFGLELGWLTPRPVAGCRLAFRL